jgi:hypothetical protein
MYIIRTRAHPAQNTRSTRTHTQAHAHANTRARSTHTITFYALVVTTYICRPRNMGIFFRALCPKCPSVRPAPDVAPLTPPTPGDQRIYRREELLVVRERDLLAQARERALDGAKLAAHSPRLPKRPVTVRCVSFVRQKLCSSNFSTERIGNSRASIHLGTLMRGARAKPSC